jgi:hypothetical protein
VLLPTALPYLAVFQTIRVVWVILAVELLLELMIRPFNYRELIHSDKAFAPATARHINLYHFVCESLALVLYIPDAICGLSRDCSGGLSLAASQAPLLATTSLSRGKAMLGRIAVGLVFLRSFGLARHWKQMWLNHNFEGGNRESCKCYDMFRPMLRAQFLTMSSMRSDHPPASFCRRKKEAS